MTSLIPNSIGGTDYFTTFTTVLPVYTRERKKRMVADIQIVSDNNFVFGEIKILNGQLKSVRVI